MNACFKIDGAFAAVSSDGLTVPAVHMSPHWAQELEEFYEYSYPGWDGYDAEPILFSTIRTASRFIDFLKDSRFYALRKPDIAPGSDGTIGFEWHRTNCAITKLFVEVRSDETLRAYWYRNGKFEHQEPRPINYAQYALQDKIKLLME